MTDPQIVRFNVGKTYKLSAFPRFGRVRGGYIIVRADLKPTDQWGNRVLLADACVRMEGGGANSSLTHLLGCRCFVEEGYATVADAYGSRTVPTEIAVLQGLYPDFAKAYAAVDEVAAIPSQPQDGGGKA